MDLIKPDISTDKHTGEHLVKQAFIKGKAISFPGGDHDIIYIVFFKQSSRRDGIFKHAFYILHLLLIVDAMSRKKERRTVYNIAASQGSDLIYMTVIGQDHSVRGSRLLNIKSCLYVIVCIIGQCADRLLLPAEYG